MSVDCVGEMCESCVELFTEHPQSVGESYCEHLTYAVKMGGRLVGLGCVAVIHGLFPFCLSTFVSSELPTLTTELTARAHVHSSGRLRVPRPPSHAPPPLRRVYTGSSVGSPNVAQPVEETEA